MNSPGRGLAVELAGLSLANPVLTAAGCGGSGKELAGFTDLAALGGFVTRTVTLDPVAGPPPPRVLGTPSGVLNADGWPNPGLQAFLAAELPDLARNRVVTVVSVAGRTLGEYGELARRVGVAPGVHAVEVNLAVRDASGRQLGADAYQLGKVVHVVRRDLPRGMPVLAKLSPSGSPGSLVDRARSAAENGADAVVLGHGYDALAIDPDTLTPRLGSVTGVLSGPAIQPLALRRVYDVHAVLPGLPIVAAGGIRTGFDALAMLAAGATAVQLGTVLLSDPTAPARVLSELAQELDTRQIASVAEVVGRPHPIEPVEENR